MKINVVVLDDEYTSLQALKSYCEKAELNVVNAYQSPTEFIFQFDTLKFDLLILDYSMPLHNGLQVAELVNSKGYPVIFVTGHRDELHKAWDLANCIDCLEKPVTVDKLKKSITKYKNQVGKVGKNETTKDYLLLDTYPNQKSKIVVDEIAFITKCNSDTSNNDRYLQTLNQKYYRLTKVSLEDLLQKLPQEKFIRINKSTIISMNAIGSISKNFETVQLKTDYIDSKGDFIPPLDSKAIGKPVLFIISDKEDYRKDFKNWFL